MKRTTRFTRIIILIAVIFLISACGSGSSKAPISGVVQFDMLGDKVTIPGIEVHLSDPVLLEAKDPNARLATVYTDEQGRYAFPDLEPGSYSLGVYAMDLEQLLSKTKGEECTIQSMDFDGVWFTVLGTSKDGKSIMISALNETVELKEGESLTYDLTVECD